MSGQASDVETLHRARRLHEDKRLAEASALYRSILAANPAHLEALTLLGLAQAEQGHLEDAVRSFDQALALSPSETAIQVRRATLLRALGRLDEALGGYEAALAVNDGIAAAWYGRGMVLTTLGRFDEAIPDFERATRLNPAQYDGQLNLGMAYERAGLPDRAVIQFIAVAEMFQQDIARRLRALNEAARVLTDLERYDEAEACLRQSLLAHPAQEEALQDITFVRQAACLWPVAQPFGPVSYDTIVHAMDPLQLATFSDDPGLQLASNARYSRAASAASFEVWPHPPASLKKGRLRIGYLSADFRNHPVPHLMYDVFGLHDRSRFEILSYHIGLQNNDALFVHVREQSDQFIDLTALDDAAACRRILDDGVDILVDLNGHTLYARPGLLSRKPAPIIVNWLGYPGTMGSDHHHYILADDWIIPPGEEGFYSEKVLRLPCYQPNPRRRVAAEGQTARADFGLPESGVVFACFNTAWKITPESFGRWMEILRAVEGSVLWLLAPQAIHDRLRAHAAESGVDGARLVFAGRMPNAEHLARHGLVDLFLDTSPYGAHTTCSDALWMGVPVITLSGRSFASRVCGSLVRSAGLPDLVFTDPDDFVREAIAIAQSPERLQACKARLAAARDSCVLFDIDAHVTRLEGLYEEMCRDYEAGSLPRPDLRLTEMNIAVRELKV